MSVKLAMDVATIVNHTGVDTGADATSDMMCGFRQLSQFKDLQKRLENTPATEFSHGAKLVMVVATIINHIEVGTGANATSGMMCNFRQLSQLKDLQKRLENTPAAEFSHGAEERFIQEMSHICQMKRLGFFRSPLHSLFVQLIAEYKLSIREPSECAAFACSPP